MFTIHFTLREECRWHSSRQKVLANGRERLRVRQRLELVNQEEQWVKLGLTKAGAIEIDEVSGKIAEATERKRKWQGGRVQ